MRISDWSSDVCSSDLQRDAVGRRRLGGQGERLVDRQQVVLVDRRQRGRRAGKAKGEGGGDARPAGCERLRHHVLRVPVRRRAARLGRKSIPGRPRSEEHTSELQSLMRISYAVFCLKKKKKNNTSKAYIN